MAEAVLLRHKRRQCLEFSGYQEKYRQDIFDLCIECSESLDTFFKPSIEHFEKVLNVGREYLVLLIDNNKAVGIVGGLPVCNFLSPELSWQEVVYYLKPEYRSYSKMLYEHLEFLLRQRGIKTITMTAPCNNKFKLTDRYFKMLGFRQLETHYAKRI